MDGDPGSRELSERSHVLLDLDGTLSHSEPGITASLRHAFEREQLTFPSAEILRGAIGPPFEIGLPTLGVPADRLWAVIGHYRDHYEAGGLFLNEPYEGVVGMLDALAEADIVLAVATAKPELTARRIIEHFGWTDRFAVIAGATFDTERRTKAEVVTYALRQLAVDTADPAVRARIVMVGDRGHDIHGAQTNGLDGIGVAWGYGSLEELVTAGAIDVVSTPADLVSLVTEPGG